MSLRVLYRKIPADKRICRYYQCEKPILRNIDRDKEGRIYHHGCLFSAQEEQYRCWNCGMGFDATEASVNFESVFFNGEYSKRPKIFCPNCGVQVRNRDQPNSKLFEVEKIE